MNAVVLLGIALVCLLLAFFTYGARVARWLGVDPARPTPAHTHTDGVDYVPARAPVLLGHHFASIAGAAPIIGPVTALAFGWGPVFLWILVGAIFMGAVHDFASLMASIRHRGRSIGEVVEAHLGYTGKVFFLVFAWTTLVLVVAVFTIVVARTFVSSPEAATASILFILLALGFGGVTRRWGVPLLPASAIGVVLLFACLVAGQSFPLAISFDTWVLVLLGYVFVASVTPIHVLLQPRDYLNSFLLYAMLILAVVGIVVARPALQAPAWTTFEVAGLGTLFPVLFVTVACGAISGFHSLVSSGTTSKQLHSEADARLVSYGSMLIEALLAVIALVAVAWLPIAEYRAFVAEGGGGPVAAFSQGLGRIIGAVGLPTDAASNFVALAVSAFALTSLDTATRLSRFAFQEFFERRSGREAGAESSPSEEPERRGLRRWGANRYAATAISVGAAAALTLSGSWKQLWPIFGSANQLLAALALLAVSVWLAWRARQNLFVLVPMVLMFVVTVSSLALFAWRHLTAPDPNYTLAVTASLLLVVGLVLVGLSVRALWGRGMATT